MVSGSRLREETRFYLRDVVEHAAMAVGIVETQLEMVKGVLRSSGHADDFESGTTDGWDSATL